jgi:hypothetical protein
VPQNLPLDQLAVPFTECSRRLTERFGRTVGVAKVKAMVRERQLESIALGKAEYITVISIENLIDRVIHRQTVTPAPAMPAPIDPERQPASAAEALALLAADCA